MLKPLFNKREVLVFHQFQRKGWSLFACLGREVVISVLSVATLSATKAAGISDEVFRVDSTKATARQVMLDNVCITGARAPLTVSQAARMVTVLSRDDIAQAPVQSIHDLLKLAVGIDVRQRGPLGAQADISIRGGSQEQIIILLNGINICDPQTGHNAMDLPCDLSDIVRIEVLEGPAGRIYGTSSLVGAVNIVTHPYPTSKEGEVYAEGGSYGYAKAGGSIKWPSLGKEPRIGSSLSASYTRSDGYSRSKSGRLNTDFIGSKAFWQGGYNDDHVQLSWHLGIADKGWGSGTFYATPAWQADEQYEHTTKLFAALQGENKQGRVRLQPAIYWNQNRDRYEGYRGRPEVMKYNRNRCNIYGLKLNSYFDWAAGRTALGAELRNEDLVSTNLGEPLTTHSSPATTHESPLTTHQDLGINRTNIAAHLEHNVLLDRMTLSAGFVAAKSSWSNMKITLYPGMDISYLLLKPQPASRHPRTVKLFASYNTSLRLPSFTEMYYRLQGYAADPHLKPEEMQALELGVQYDTPALQGKLSAYHHHGRNMIDWIMDTSQGEQAVWQSVNHTKINSFGVEATAAVNLKAAFRSPLSSLHLAYSYITQDKKAEPGIVSQYVQEYLRHKLVARLHADLGRSLAMSLNLRWQNRVGSYTSFSGEVCDYRPFALLDVRLQWTKARHIVYAEANNVLNNRSYVDFGNVPQPGTWIVVGTRIEVF